MPTLFLNELESAGNATGIGYPNLRSCVSVTAILANATLVGAHLTKQEDIKVIAPRFLRLVGEERITRLYLIGGFSQAGNLHGDIATYPARVAAALNEYRGDVATYDTSRFVGVLLVVDQPDISGHVRVQYKDWNKLTPDMSPMEKGEHPYKDTKNPYVTITLDVKRNPKKGNATPALIMHDIPLKKFKVVTI